MKTVNVILSVLVLIAAVVSAVFSYFLYEKRVAFVEGWEQLSAAIYDNAKTLDRNSGTNAAKELTAEKLSHTGYSADAMKKSLGTFVKQGKAIAAQRDMMAETLQSVGRTVSAGTGSAADFKAVDSSEEQSAKVKKAVSAVISNRSKVFRALNNIVRVDSNKLSRGDVSGLNPVKNMAEAKESYKNTIANLARLANVSGPGRDANAAVDSKNIERAVIAKINSVNQIRIQLDRANNTVYTQKQTIASKDKTISSRDAVIAEKNRQINDLKRALGIDPDGQFAMWTAEEARLRTAGEVTKVSDEYGYIVLNLGTASTAAQKAGKKVINVSLDLKSGLEFYVVRGSDNDLIAVVTLDKVGEKESTANIPMDKVGKIKTGDKVLYKQAK